MKARIVNVDGHDPLAQAVGKEWSHRQHHEASRAGHAGGAKASDPPILPAGFAKDEASHAAAEHASAMAAEAARIAAQAGDEAVSAVSAVPAVPAVPGKPARAKGSRAKARAAGRDPTPSLPASPSASPSTSPAARPASSPDALPVPERIPDEEREALSRVAQADADAVPGKGHAGIPAEQGPAGTGGAPEASPPGEPTKAAAETSVPPGAVKRLKHAPLPSAKPPTADQKRLLVKGMKGLHVVEAALFSAGKPLSIDEIHQETALEPQAIKDAIKELSRLYAERDTVLEVGKAGTKWAMQVRSQAAEPASRFAPMEIAPKLLKTLALIAYHQPMKQSELVDMIGTKAYDHVPELVERGLVRAKEEGSTKVLVTTPQFPEYFGLDAANADEVKSAMAKLVGLPPREAHASAASPTEGRPQAASDPDVAADAPRPSA